MTSPFEFDSNPQPIELTSPLGLIPPCPRVEYQPQMERREKHEHVITEDVVLVSDGNGNMVDPSFITRKYLGVTYHKRNKKWIAQASENGRSKYLGCFKTPEKAARMYDAYVVSKGGENVKTNFPVTEIDPTLKPLVKRYKKRSRDVLSFHQQMPMQTADPWESYLQGISEQFAKRRKRSRDPTAPKGPRNAYMMYIQKNREKLQKECVDSPLKEGNSFGAISRELGRRWKALSTEERKEFEDLAAKDKVRHEREKREYESKLKGLEENQRNQEAYMKVLQQHYQEYAKVQSQWLSIMGYGQPQNPGSPPTLTPCMYNYSQMQQLQASLPPQDPSQLPATLPISPFPNPKLEKDDSEKPKLSEKPTLPTAPPTASFQNFFNMDDCSELYEQLGYTDYTPEELSCLQSAWVNAAQQAQFAELAKNQSTFPDLFSDNQSEQEQKDLD